MLILHTGFSAGAGQGWSSLQSSSASVALGSGLAHAEARSCLKETNLTQATSKLITSSGTGMGQSQLHGGKQPSGSCCILTSTAGGFSSLFLISELEFAELFFHFAHRTMLLLLLKGGMGKQGLVLHPPWPSPRSAQFAAEQGCRINYQCARIILLASLGREAIHGDNAAISP